jgi:hypothetical protein
MAKYRVKRNQDAAGHYPMYVDRVGELIPSKAGDFEMIHLQFAADSTGPADNYWYYPADLELVAFD